MLESQHTSTVRSLTEICIDLVQDKSETDNVDLSILKAANFAYVRDLEESITVLIYMNYLEELATPPEQCFVQKVISRCLLT